MTIKEIRATIDALNWARQYFQGGTREENNRCEFAKVIADYVRNVRELVIPARFGHDITRRQEALDYAERAITRWQANRDAAAA